MAVFHKSGDLLTAEEPAIGHGVNCRGVMATGVAKPVRATFGEEMHDDYRRACSSGELKPGGLHVWTEGKPVLLNIASQDQPGPDARIDWLAEGILHALWWAKEHNMTRIALPRIGCGIGGLSWEPVEAVLFTASVATAIDVVVYTPSGAKYRQ